MHAFSDSSGAVTEAVGTSTHELFKGELFSYPGMFSYDFLVPLPPPPDLQILRLSSDRMTGRQQAIYACI
jgi:hypothetical protein